MNTKKLTLSNPEKKAETYPHSSAFISVKALFKKNLPTLTKTLIFFLIIVIANTQPTQAQTPTPKIQQQRLKPNFSEEERRIQNQGFRNTFLGDSLNGLSDPLGGGNAGISVVEQESLTPISPQERGILPAFDPTDVIIPRAGVRR